MCMYIYCYIYTYTAAFHGVYPMFVQTQILKLENFILPATLWQVLSHAKHDRQGLPEKKLSILTATFKLEYV